MKPTLLLAGAALLAFAGAANAQTTAPTTDTTSPAGTQSPPDTGMAAPDNGAAAPDTGMASPSTDSSSTGTATPTDTTSAPTSQGSGMSTTAAPPPSGGDQSGTGPATAGGPTASSASVQADWAKYDPKNTGSLTPLAFGNWLMASRGQDMTAQVTKTQAGKQKNLPAVKVLNATASDFAKADTDHDHKVTPAEMSAYLGAS